MISTPPDGILGALASQSSGGSRDKVQIAGPPPQPCEARISGAAVGWGGRMCIFSEVPPNHFWSLCRVWDPLR